MAETVDILIAGGTVLTVNDKGHEISKAAQSLSIKIRLSR